MTELNTPKVREFEAKRKQWVKWLSGKDYHSVMNQITRMIWDAAVFRGINEARKYAVNGEGKVELNGTVHDLINRGFFVLQASAIRRLMDKSTAAGTRGVYSLYGLLDDMAKNARLITREHIFVVENIEYDYESVKEAYYQYAQEQIKAGKKGYGRPTCFSDWHRSEKRHADIDKLSGIDESQKMPGDSIRPDCFVRLKKKLDVCNEVLTYVNKFIAHSATPDSRATVLPVTLGHLLDAHKAICEVANFVSIYILGGNSFGGLATPQYNQFEYIDQPLVTSENVPRLYEVWHEYDREVHDWSLWGLDEFETETA